MSKSLEFCFDVGSPTAYLAHKRLQQLRRQYGLELQYTPILLGGVFKATGNVSPVTIPAKGKYMTQQDLPRFARRYGVTLRFNPHFPINTLTLMRAAVAARRLGCFDTYVDTVYDAIWARELDMRDPDVVAKALTDAGLDAEKLLVLAGESDVKAELAADTEAAVARGVFGAPTMFMDGQMYFGQDRLDFVEEALRG